MLVLLRIVVEAFGTAVGRSFPSWDVALDHSRRREPKIRRGQFVCSGLGMQSCMFYSIKEIFRALKTLHPVFPPEVDESTSSGEIDVFDIRSWEIPKSGLHCCSPNLSSS